MNIHESQMDEFKDEQQFQKLNLTVKQVESWIMVYLLLVYPLYILLHCAKEAYCL